EVIGGQNSNGNGSIYELSPASGTWTETILHYFAGSPDGASPFQNPVFGAKGNLFGTTYEGGLVDSCQYCGTIYELKPQNGGQWAESVVHNIARPPGGADGYQPVAG